MPKIYALLAVLLLPYASAVDAQLWTKCCRFTNGPKAGQTQCFPQAAAVQVGGYCQDGILSSGHAVADNQRIGDSRSRTGRSRMMSVVASQPLEVRWMAFNGPPCPQSNHHHCLTANQQYAYDIVPVDNNGMPAPDLCSGSRVYSPFSGRIVQRFDSATMRNNPAPTYGNHVVIGLGQNRYAVLAHFQPDSVTQEVNISEGDYLGKCGNTGNSTHPHVHLHVQTGSNIMNLKAQGIEIMFDDVSLYQRSGECRDMGRYSPQNRDIVC